MEHLARDHGLVVKSSVSGKVRVLVVGDPDTQSGKAQKARLLGTRIMSERAFIHLLDIQAAGT
jgi:DNA polymerase-3 subunit epsilon